MNHLAKLILARLDFVGDDSPALRNLAADIIELCAQEAAGWTNRADDACRIPDMLYETVSSIRKTVQEERRSSKKPTKPR
jgi:hypothetical protein